MVLYYPFGQGRHVLLKFVAMLVFSSIFMFEEVLNYRIFACHLATTDNRSSFIRENIGKFEFLKTDIFYA